jgi:Cysteine rich repeat
MVRYMLVLVLSFVVSPTDVSAQRAAGHKGTLQQQQACRPDVLRYCRDAEGDDDDIADCLKEHMQKLRPACRQVFQEGRRGDR